MKRRWHRGRILVTSNVTLNRKPSVQCGVWTGRNCSTSTSTSLNTLSPSTPVSSGWESRQMHREWFVRNSVLLCDNSNSSSNSFLSAPSAMWELLCSLLNGKSSIIRFPLSLGTDCLGKPTFAAARTTYHRCTSCQCQQSEYISLCLCPTASTAASQRVCTSVQQTAATVPRPSPQTPPHSEKCPKTFLLPPLLVAPLNVKPLTRPSSVAIAGPSLPQSSIFLLILYFEHFILIFEPISWNKLI